MDVALMVIPAFFLSTLLFTGPMMAEMAGTRYRGRVRLAAGCRALLVTASLGNVDTRLVLDELPSLDGRGGSMALDHASLVGRSARVPHGADPELSDGTRRVEERRDLGWYARR